MMTTRTIRTLTAADLGALTDIVRRADLFPPEMLPETTAGFLAAPDRADALWLVASHSGALAGFCYAAPETLAEGAWNMLALGVAPGSRRLGLAAALTADLERRLRARPEARLLLADTSGTEGFAAARAFYAAQGFAAEARIRDYWADDDDKVTFTKRLSACGALARPRPSRQSRRQ